ncbi:hypothetical protein [Brytella acorum]|uniref:Uncharacterized protein n=1 Tax=Brytella acorum TaxID=2959299 RepID=A0AA35ULC8_9PROT|nr:hypothetical protein [Brytella acorum]CAI9119557.1 hypothetical protein LMG32879_000374 [Brytella acorum]
MDRFETLLTETVAPVLATLRTTHQTGTSAVTDRTAKEWLAEYGCAPKGRHGLATKLSNTLRALANKTGTPLLRCARTNTWLFPYDIAVPFMEGQGKAWIRLHNDAVEKGQSALALKGLPKLDFADMTVMRAKAMTLEECADAIGRSLAVAERIHDRPKEANIGNCERSLRSAARTLIYLWGRVQGEKIEQEKALLARMERLRDGLREDNRRAEMA